MFKEARVRGREIVGKVVVSDETGSKFGKVSDITFIAETGELLSLILTEPTKTARESNLQQDDNGNYVVPFSAVKSIGDFVIVSEKDIF